MCLSTYILPRYTIVVVVNGGGSGGYGGFGDDGVDFLLLLFLLLLLMLMLLLLLVNSKVSFVLCRLEVSSKRWKTGESMV